MRATLAIVALLAAGCAAAIAQVPGGMPSLSPAERAEAAAGCDELGRMPNAPMSVDACKSMLGMMDTAERMRASAADPSAQRPGDARLSCDAIFAEMKALGVEALAGEGSQHAGAALAQAQAVGTRQHAEGTAFVAGTFALGAAMGAASAVMPNFVAAAIVAAWQASAVALGTRHAAEQQALRPQRDAAIVETTEDLEWTMAANPRFARLAMLGMDKGCEAPVGATR